MGRCVAAGDAAGDGKSNKCDLRVEGRNVFGIWCCRKGLIKGGIVDRRTHSDRLTVLRQFRQGLAAVAG